MSTFTPPQALTQTYEWLTDIHTSRNGSEVRMATRQIPRQKFSITHLATTDEEIQNWKWALVSALDDTWYLPLWAESVQISTAVSSTDATVDADFTLMDDSLGALMLLLHPNERLYQVCAIASRTATTATLDASTVTEDYPLGSVLVPITIALVQNNLSYNSATNAAATLTLGDMVADTSEAVTGKGSIALSTYNTKVLLDRRHLSEGSSDVFNIRQQRLDYDHAVMVESAQNFSKITTGRTYLSSGPEDRQWWKLFLSTVNGRQKSFYASTYRPDMTVFEQPSVGGTTFKVLDDATVAIGWATIGISSHQDLAIQTADGNTQLVSLVSATNNFNGLHTVEILPALTATTLGSTIERISFLELVRLGSDTVEIDHGPEDRLVKLSLTTIQE